MTASISVGLTGIAGWKVLQRSEERQLQAVAQDAVVQRSTEYFREKLSAGLSTDDLIGDYKMLSVALKAYGLEDDLPNKAFIRKVLESDLSDTGSLANRLSDKRYLKLAQAFNLTSENLDKAALGKQVTDAYIQREYEARVGAADETYRLSLNAQREVQAMASRGSSNKTLWYEVIGNSALREVFSTALGFGDNYASLPIDRQLEEFTKAADRILGTSDLKEIATSGGIDKMITNYLARSQLASNSIAQNRYSAALTLLAG